MIIFIFPIFISAFGHASEYDLVDLAMDIWGNRPESIAKSKMEGEECKSDRELRNCRAATTSILVNNSIPSKVLTCNSELRVEETTNRQINLAFKSFTLSEWTNYLFSLNLSIDDLEDIQAEIDYAFAVWERMVGSEPTAIHPYSPLLRKLFAEIGAVIYPEQNGSMLVDQADEAINISSFAHWYVKWLNTNNEMNH